MSLVQVYFLPLFNVLFRTSVFNKCIRGVSSAEYVKECIRSPAHFPIQSSLGKIGLLLDLSIKLDFRTLYASNEKQNNSYAIFLRDTMILRHTQVPYEVFLQPANLLLSKGVRRYIRCPSPVTA